MPIQFDKFDQQKIDRLKNHLLLSAQKGFPKSYEIYVDHLKAVPRTDEPSEFEGYEDYMSADTQQIKIVIYNSPDSPRNDQYVFSMKAQSSQEALELGLDGTSLRMLSKNDLQHLREQRDRQAAENRRLLELEAQVGDLSGTISDKDSRISELESQIKDMKEKANTIWGIDLGQLAGDALNNLIRNNTGAIAQIPALEGIARAIELDEQEKIENALSRTPHQEVSFKKKTPGSDSEAGSELSAQDKTFIALNKDLQQELQEGYLDVLELLGEILDDKRLLAELKSHVQQWKQKA